jgi:hypothetical protein
MISSDGPLAPIVEEIEKHADAGEPVSIDMVKQVAGGQVAGPLLLLPALVAMSPLTIFPGVPSLIGLNTVLVAGQIVLGRRHIWLPKWLRSRTLSARHTQKLLKVLKPVGKVADSVAKPRLSFLTAWPLRRIGALVCVLIGLAMPLTEVIPFSSTWVGATIAIYALAITARDGMLVLAWIGLVLSIAAIASSFLF